MSLHKLNKNKNNNKNKNVEKMKEISIILNCL